MSEKNSYYNARSRCTNPNFPNWENYGGRGIEFRFSSFEEFLGELGPRPEGKTLDRINTNGHYEPGNVRWATPKEQQKNRRPDVVSNGGYRTHELHPNLASENGRRSHKLHPDLASRTINRYQKLHPEIFSKAGRIGGPACAHLRWHVRRGITNPNCALCRRNDGR
jgi:hypothetical protein